MSSDHRLKEGFSYTILDEKDITKKQEALLNQLCEEVAFSPTIANGSLLMMKWDVNKIIAAYLDNTQKFFKEIFNLDLDEAEQRVKELKNAG